MLTLQSISLQETSAPACSAKPPCVVGPVEAALHGSVMLSLASPTITLYLERGFCTATQLQVSCIGLHRNKIKNKIKV